MLFQSAQRKRSNPESRAMPTGNVMYGQYPETVSRAVDVIEIWCNGSTTDFGSV